MNNHQPWYYSWPVIIIAFLIFWPLGIALIILRSKGSKQSIFMGTTDKKKYYILGLILIIFGIYSLIKKSFLIGIFAILGGLFVGYYATSLAKRSARNRKYIDMIVNHHESSIDRIASVVGLPYNKCLSELNQMISLGVLKNANIDTNTHTIRIETPAIEQQQGGGFMNSLLGSDNGGAEMVTASCPGCGAKVVLRKGSTITCEYCDAPIKG